MVFRLALNKRKINQDPPSLSFAEGAARHDRNLD